MQPSSPVLLRIFVEELNENGLATGDKSEVDVAVVIDDVINLGRDKAICHAQEEHLF